MTRRRLASRRAFALPLTLVILLSVSLIVTVAMQRQAAQTRVVQRQINEYKKRHDAHGVRAIVLRWIKDIPRSELAALAESAGPAQFFELPSGAAAVVRVFDGQGLPLRATASVGSEMQAPYRDMLGRLAARPDLTRGAGPWQISIGGAPRVVLEAMVSKSGPEFADEVLRMRRVDGGVDRADFSRLVSTMAIDGEDRRFLTRAVSFESSLWRIVVETEDWAGKRRYDMLVERTPSRTTVHEWFEYAESDLNRFAESDADE